MERKVGEGEEEVRCDWLDGGSMMAYEWLVLFERVCECIHVYWLWYVCMYGR